MNLFSATAFAALCPVLVHAASFTCEEAQTCLSKSGENAVSCAQQGIKFTLAHGGSMAPVTIRIEGRAPETFVGLGPSGGALARGMGQPGLGTALKSVVLFEELNFVITSTSGTGETRMVEMMTGQCKKAAE